MATVTELLQPVELDLEALLSDLRSLIGAGHPILQAAAEHLFSAGGKRIRPGIVLLVSRALSKDGNLKEAAKNLYSTLRKIKKNKYLSIAVSKIPDKGLGKTINDRLKRASKF